MRKAKSQKIKIEGKELVLLITWLFTSHAICFHEWQDATCDEPQKCDICGRTKGEPVGHDYTEPTCIEPATCRICGETSGEPLGHAVKGWNIDTEATCQSEGTLSGFCERCKRTVYKSIPVIPHAEGEWIVEKEPVINADATVTPGLKVLLCKACSETIKTEEYTIELTHGQTSALKKARDVIDAIHLGPGYLVEMLVQNYGFELEDANFALEYCGADWNEQCVLNCKGLISEGESDRMIVQMLRFYGFTDDQIKHALQETGIKD